MLAQAKRQPAFKGLVSEEVSNLYLGVRQATKTLFKFVLVEAREELQTFSKTRELKDSV